VDKFVKNVKTIMENYNNKQYESLEISEPEGQSMKDTMVNDNNKQYEALRPHDPSRHIRAGGTFQHASTLSFIRLWEKEVIISTSS
jgi:hypothetical protein